MGSSPSGDTHKYKNIIFIVGKIRGVIPEIMDNFGGYVDKNGEMIDRYPYKYNGIDVGFECIDDDIWLNCMGEYCPKGIEIACSYDSPFAEADEKIEAEYGLSGVFTRTGAFLIDNQYIKPIGYIGINDDTLCYRIITNNVNEVSSDDERCSIVVRCRNNDSMYSVIDTMYIVRNLVVEMETPSDNRSIQYCKFYDNDNNLIFSVDTNKTDILVQESQGTNCVSHTNYHVLHIIDRCYPTGMLCVYIDKTDDGEWYRLIEVINTGGGHAAYEIHIKSALLDFVPDVTEMLEYKIQFTEDEATDVKDVFEDIMKNICLIDVIFYDDNATAVEFVRNVQDTPYVKCQSSYQSIVDKIVSVLMNTNKKCNKFAEYINDKFGIVMETEDSIRKSLESMIDFKQINY